MNNLHKNWNINISKRNPGPDSIPPADVGVVVTANPVVAAVVTADPVVAVTVESPIIL